MAINFPTNPNNGDVHAGFTYNSTKSVWESVAPSMMPTSDTPPTSPSDGQMWFDTDGGGAFVYYEDTDSAQWVEVIGSAGADGAAGPAGADGSAAVYATVDDLPGTASAGDQAFVTASNRLYLWNGSGWYNIALINTTPSISGVSSSYTLATDGTATTVTITAVDPEGLPITYSIASDTSGNIATVTQNANVFTITPSTSDANAGTFSLTFRASDGVNVATAISEFTLQFSVQNSNYTTALITSVGDNNAVNNSFVDSSSNSHTITAAGNVTQNTFSPYRHGGNAVSFAGTNSSSENYLLINAAIVPSTGSWTYESWVKVDRKSDGEPHSLISWYTNSVAGRGNIYVRADNATDPGTVFVYVDGMSAYPQSTTRVDDGAWHHVVVERDGNVWSVWIDGTRENQETQNVTLNTSVNTRLGHIINVNATSHFGFKGLMRDVRFSASARYQGAASINVPTEDQTTTTGYALLCCQSFDPFTDKTGNREITVYSSTSVKQVGAGPYEYETYSAGTNGGSMYFDGSGDNLTTPTHASFSLGSGDLTIEGWFYNTSTAQYQFIFDGRQGGGASDTTYLYTNNGTTLKTGFGNTNDAIAATIVQNQWYHFALVRSGSGTNNVTLYLNGENVWNITDTTDLSSSTRMTVGSRYNITNDFGGHVSDFRVVKGTAVYTADFTPPTAPLTAITNTSLLLSGTNAGIIDKSQTAKPLTLNGDVKSSTTQTKYLSSSMYFDGTGDYITASPGDDIAAFGTADFTVEGWFYVESGDEFPFVLDFRSTDIQVAGVIYFHNYGNGDVDWYVNGVSQKLGTSAGLNTWQHIAVCRSGTSTKMFINGTQSGSITDTNNYVAASTVDIGQRWTAQRRFKGYMSDVRITKGLARYTANFTPPVAALKG